MTRIIAAALLAAGLAACGTTSGPLGPLPEIADSSGAAKVVVVRVSSVIGAAAGVKSDVGPRCESGLGSGEHAEFRVPAGEHAIAIGCFGGLVPKWNQESLRFTAQPGASLFFIVSPSASCAELRAATEAEARTHLQSSRSVASAPVAPAASSAAPAPERSGAAEAAREVPGLKVTLDCGGCEVRDSIPALIAEGYARAAAEKGAKVAANADVSVAIREYSARDTGARFFLGALAGRDEIKAAVRYKEGYFVVEDYYANAWLGIEQLATKIGEMVFQRVNPDVAAAPRASGERGEGGSGKLGNSPEFRKGRGRNQSNQNM